MRAPTPHDIALFGFGVQTAFGDTDATWAALEAGATAIRARAPGAFAARIDTPTLGAELPRALDPQVKFLSGSGKLAAAACHEAWSAALSDDIPDVNRGLYLAQMDGDDWNCRDFREAAHMASDDLAVLDQAAMNRASLRYLKPFFLLEGLKNNAFSFIATWLDLRGANTSTAGSASLGTTLLDLARRALQHGTLRRALVCGAGRISADTAVYELASVGLQMAGDGQQPAPLTTASAGFVPGDAAAALVLGPVSEAPHGHVATLGVGSATCLTERARARSEALVQAATQALNEAEIEPGDLTAIVAPGTGLPAETEALAQLPAAAADTPVVCWAGATGYAALAADTLDLALATHALRSGRIPAALVPSGARPELPQLATTPIEAPRGSALLVLSMGAFGHAGAVILRS